MRISRSSLLLVVLALVLAACGTSSAEDSSGGLATLTETTQADAVEVEEVSDEDAILEFADCVRENGLPDFEDPIVGADGSVEFVGVGPGTGEPGDFRAAFEACGDLLEDTTFTGGRGGDFDLVELQDTLLELASCLRDNGLEVDDPDISEGFGGNRDDGAEPGSGGGRLSLFGDSVDLSDPETQEIFEACAEEVNLTPPGGGAGPGAGG